MVIVAKHNTSIMRQLRLHKGEPQTWLKGLRTIFDATIADVKESAEQRDEDPP